MKLVFLSHPSDIMLLVMEKGTVAASEAAGNDIYPWCDDCHNVFEQVVGWLEFKVWAKVIPPRKSFVAVSA
jgi:hypothetical protein